MFLKKVLALALGLALGLGLPAAAQGNLTVDDTVHYGGTGNDQYRAAVRVPGGTIAVGQSDSTDVDLAGMDRGEFDAIIVKYSDNGDVVWKHNFGGSAEDYFRGIALAPDGVLAVGYSNSTDGDLAGLNKGSWDAVLVKYDFDGNLQWNRNFGGSYTDYFFSAAAVDDGFLLVGQSSSTNQDLAGCNKGGFDATVAKYSFDGALQWNRNFGGSALDRFYFVAPVDGGFLAAGNSASNDQDLAGQNLGLQDAVLARYDSAGSLVWNVNYGSSRNDYFYTCLPTGTGFAAAGSTEDPAGNTGPDAALVQYDGNGRVLWERQFGGSANDYFYGLVPTPTGLLATGTSNSVNGDLQGLNRGSSDAVFAQYSPAGELLWNENFGGSNFDCFYTVLPAAQGYAAAGYSTSRDQQLQGLNFGRQDAIFTRLRIPFAAVVRYSTTAPTPGPVTATLVATEPIETPAGWTKINGTTFTKQYTQNANEQLTLTAVADQKQITVTVSVDNITAPDPRVPLVWLLAAVLLLALVLMLLCCGC